MIRYAFALSAAIVVASCSPPAEPTPQEPAAAAPVAPPVAGEAPVLPPPAATPPAEGQASDDWRRYALPNHPQRIAALPEAFERAVAAARQAGHGAEMEPLGVLIQSTTALDRPVPSPGPYRCRSIQFSEGSLPFLAYPFFRCEVEVTPGGDLILRKLTGSQRFEGKLYPDGEKRLVYLGGAAWGYDETGYPPYGQSAERDQVGVFERIAASRYRLTLSGGLPGRVEVVELAR